MRTQTRTIALAALLALAGCSRPDPLADLGVSAEAVVFDAPAGTDDPAAQVLYVTNTGEGHLGRPEVSIVYGAGAAGWLFATVGTSGAPYAVTLAAAVGTLAPGSYGATLTIASAGAASTPVQVPVTLRVPEPRFVPSRTALELTAWARTDPGMEYVRVTNGGRGTLPVPQVSIAYVGTGDWLSVEVSGTPGDYRLAVRPDPTGLDSGTYAATLALTAPGVAGPVQTISVLLVIPPPVLEMGLLSMRFDAPDGTGEPEAQFVAVWNGGGGILPMPLASIVYDPPAETGWLDVEVVGSAGAYSVAVRATAGTLPAGTYTARVGLELIGDPASRHEVPVTLVVPPPRLALEPSGSVTFVGGQDCPAPDPKVLWALNGSRGTLAMPVATLAPGGESWLAVSVAPAAGSAWPNGGPYAVTFQVVALPPPGTSTVVRLASAGAEPVDVPVVYQETARDPTFTPAIATFGLQGRLLVGAGRPEVGRATVYAVGACVPAPTVAIEYLEGGEGWLSSELATTPSGHAVKLLATGAGLEPGPARSARITVATAGASAVLQVAFTAGTFVGTGSLNVPRADHAVAALPDGRLLASGGRPGLVGALASAELYDPVTESWSPTGAMAEARAKHAAAVLPDGRVVVAGGAGASGLALDSVEVYDPATGAWTPGGRLLEAHPEPVLVPLRSGDVLVAGGFLSTCEVWSPATSSSTACPTWWGSPPDAAVALADGRVMVASGGYTWYFDGTDLPPYAGTMQTYRVAPALHLLADGRVLALGGVGDPYFRSTAEVWMPPVTYSDPATGAPPQTFGWWTFVAPPPRIFGRAIALDDGRALLFGGLDGLGVPTLDVAVLAAPPGSAGAWSDVEARSTAGLGHAVARTATGLILVSGGFTADGNAAVGDVFRW